jgi:hypothetical protein
MNLNHTPAATFSIPQPQPYKEITMATKKGSGTAAAVRRPKGKRGNGAQKLKQKKK